MYEYEPDTTRELAEMAAIRFSLDTWPEKSQEEHEAYMEENWENHIPSPLEVQAYEEWWEAMRKMPPPPQTPAEKLAAVLEGYIELEQERKRLMEAGKDTTRIDGRIEEGKVIVRKTACALLGIDPAEFGLR